MSNISAEIKKRRQQHRQDHYTNRDRKLNQKYRGDQKGRIAERRTSYQTDNKTAAGFNFDKFGTGHIGRGEVKHLKQQGFSNDEIMAAAKASGNEIGSNSQNIFSRWEANAKKPPVKDTPDVTTPPVGPRPVVTSDNINASTTNKLTQDVELNNAQKSYMKGDNMRNEQYMNNAVELEGGDTFSMAGSGPVGAEALKNSYVDSIIKNIQEQKVKSTSPQESEMIGNGSYNFQVMDNSVTNKGGNLYNSAYS